MQIFLVHGMGRSPFGLFPLARSLRKAGHTTSFFGYSVALRGFDENAELLLTHIRKNADPSGYAIVAHSLGGILARAISEELPPGFNKLVMLGPPNRPVTLAKLCARNVLYRRLTGSSGAHLGDEAFYRDLPIPDVPTLIVAGNMGPAFPFSPFVGAPNDGIVTVEETQLPRSEQLPQVEYLVVHAVHTWIMNDPLARLAIVAFLA